MQVDTQTLFAPDIPLPMLRSYYKGKEYVTLCLAPHPLSAEDGALWQDYLSTLPNEEGDEGKAYVYTSISIINDGEHLTLIDVIRIAQQQGVDLNAETLAALASGFHVENYEALVPMLIRARFSADDEFSFQRKAILGDTAEFETYNEYVQQCKQLAQAAFAK